MALEALSPFSRAQFSRLVAPFVTWADEYVATEEIDGRVGWHAHFESYGWAGNDWRDGLRSRREMSCALAAANSDEQLRDAIADIADWGGMQTLGREDVDQMAASLSILDAIRDGGEAWPGLHARRIATASKVYEMHDPTSWTIYDARVAAALVKLVDSWWSEVGSQQSDSLLRFGIPPARGPRTDLPSEFPVLGSPKQARLNFIYASWLLRDIAERLASIEIGPDDADWQLVHVEMALFMLGSSSADWG